MYPQPKIARSPFDKPRQTGWAHFSADAGLNLLQFTGINDGRCIPPWVGSRAERNQTGRPDRPASIRVARSAPVAISRPSQRRSKPFNFEANLLSYMIEGTAARRVIGDKRELMARLRSTTFAVSAHLRHRAHHAALVSERVGREFRGLQR